MTSAEVNHTAWIDLSALTLSETFSSLLLLMPVLFLRHLTLQYPRFLWLYSKLYNGLSRNFRTKLHNCFSLPILAQILVWWMEIVLSNLVTAESVNFITIGNQYNKTVIVIKENNSYISHTIRNWLWQIMMTSKVKLVIINLYDVMLLDFSVERPNNGGDEKVC